MSGRGWTILSSFKTFNVAIFERSYTWAVATTSLPKVRRWLICRHDS